MIMVFSLRSRLILCSHINITNIDGWVVIELVLVLDCFFPVVAFLITVCPVSYLLFVCVSANFMFLVWTEKIYFPSLWTIRALPAVKVYGRSSFHTDCSYLGLKRPRDENQEEIDNYYERFLSHQK